MLARNDGDARADECALKRKRLQNVSWLGRRPTSARADEVGRRRETCNGKSSVSIGDDGAASPRKQVIRTLGIGAHEPIVSSCLESTPRRRCDWIEINRLVLGRSKLPVGCGEN